MHPRPPPPVEGSWLISVQARAQQASAKTGSGGDLAKRLAEQRRLTQRATLEEASRQNVREREVDASADVLRNA